MYICKNCNTENMLKSHNVLLCKPCYSKKETTKIMIARAEKDPKNYLTCDDCDGIFKRTQMGRYKKLRTNCPYCKSENLERY